MRSVFVIILTCLFALVVNAQEEKQDTYVKGMHIGEGAKVSVFGNLHNVADTLYNDGHLTLIGDSLINDSPIKGTGTLELMGDYDQHITHKGIIIVDSLILNNTLDISFDNNIIINDHAVFINGILYDEYDVSVSPTNLPTVTFGEKATVDSATVRDASHIEGMVKKSGRTRFVFPIGDAGFYRPAMVDNIPYDTTISAHYYYEWIDYPEDKLQLGVEIYRDEYWYISGNTKDVDLTLTYDDQTSTFDADQEGIEIVAYDSLRDFRYRLIDVESTSVMSRLAYLADSALSDSSFVWYSFGRLDPDQGPDVDLYVPQILSPNGDDKNDKFVIKGLSKYPDCHIVVINRYGDKVYEKKQYDNSWDGTGNKGIIGGSNKYLLPSGTYFVFLYNHGDLLYKDFVQLIRTN